MVRVIKLCRLGIQAGLPVELTTHSHDEEHCAYHSISSLPNGFRNGRIPATANPLLMRLLIAWLFMAIPVFAESPVVSTHRELWGYELATAETAEISVVVSYKVPGVVNDTDTFYFKRFWSQVQKHADGTSSFNGPTLGGILKSRCGPIGGCSGAANVDPQDEGFSIDLDLRWDRKEQRGSLKRHFLVTWSELEKTVKDDEVEIHVAVQYAKQN